MGIPTVIGVSLLIFGIMSILPGNVAIAILGDRASQEAIDDLRDELGLNDPWYQRYGSWITSMVSGDMGKSLFLTQRPIKDLLASHFPITLNITIYAMILAFAVGVPLGAISAMRPDSWIDYLARSISIIGLSIPVFFLGLVILLIFAFVFSWQPDWQWVSPFKNPWTNLQQMFWPSLTTGYFQVAFIARMTRSALLEVLLEDYMRTARAKGLKERVVVMRHGLRNAVIPIVTVAGLGFVTLLSGVVITERVFNLAGWGTLLWEAVVQRDFRLVQTMVFIFALAVIGINLLIDILYAWLDPRIRYA